MGVGIRTRLTAGAGSEPGELTDDDVQSALGRLSAYDAQPPRTERRRPVDSDASAAPALRPLAALDAELERLGRPRARLAIGAKDVVGRGQPA